MTSKEKKIFNMYPTAKEIYKDSNGNYWLSKITAVAQSSDNKCETITKQQTKSTPQKTNSSVKQKTTTTRKTTNKKNTKSKTQ
ncbi:MAG: hypothetical protein MI922_24630 [Bacteroidales bacterium]|nr:hypothetical protein [Bacteroidales bacterium]